MITAQIKVYIDLGVTINNGSQLKKPDTGQPETWQTPETWTEFDCDGSGKNSILDD